MRTKAAALPFIFTSTFGFYLASAGNSEPAHKVASPLSPEKARVEFRMDPGLRVELAAAEPQIESPVAMAFDEDGKLWVVEMRDYPNGPGPNQPPQGRIKVLEDRDGDGFFEHSSVFAENLLFANGVMPWRGGVIVTMAPSVSYFRDADGDGKAEPPEVLFEGFTAKNPQLRVSHPVLGIDNRVYLANGLLGGEIRRAGKKDTKPLNISSMDFCFDPTNPDRFEAITGMGQYGNTFDDWGRRFVCNNRNHVVHIVLPDRYVRRNPFLAVPSPVMPNQEPGGAAKIFPLGSNWTTSNLHAGSFTSACSVFIYRGSLLPSKYRGTAFTCEPAGSLVHQELLEPDGATFKLRRVREGVEFLASPDDWCRPVFLSHGPDGAMYVVDMYRAVIEHPEFVPRELKNRPDLHLGKERGRIWRIVPENHKARAHKPQLSTATTKELVALLSHKDAWWRTTAQRLLLERQDRAAVRELQSLIASAKEPVAKAHAAWLLDSLSALEESHAQTMLKDSPARVREHGLRLAERWLKSSGPIQQSFVRLAKDTDPQVRFQAALSLGEWGDERILPSLARIALAGAEDRWTRLAVASAVPQRAGALLTLLLKQPDGRWEKPSAGRWRLVKELAALVGGRKDTAEVAQVLESLWSIPGGPVATQMAGLNGLAEGMGRRGTQLAEFIKSLPPSQTDAVERINSLFAKAANVAVDGSYAVKERLEAIVLLAHGPWPVAKPALMRLLNEEPLQEIRLAAVRGLGAHPTPEVAAILVKPWDGYTPALRREITEAMLQKPERVAFLLDEVEAGRIRPADIDTARVRQLVSHSQSAIRARSSRLFRGNLPEARKQVLERYKAALALKGNPSNGRNVFQKNCATCHHIAGVGVQVGPDISDTRVKSPEQLLTDILSPNQAIDNNYVNYVVTTKNGKVVTGMIAAETASNLTLRRAENQTDIVLRQDIETIQSTGMSLMPEDVEKNVSVEEMADLIGFLKNWRYLDGNVPTSPG